MILIFLFNSILSPQNSIDYELIMQTDQVCEPQEGRNQFIQNIIKFSRIKINNKSDLMIEAIVAKVLAVKA